MLNWRTPGSPEAVARALEMLLKAKRPLILAGGGWSGLKNFARTSRING